MLQVEFIRIDAVAFLPDILFGPFSFEFKAAQRNLIWGVQFETANAIERERIRVKSLEMKQQARKSLFERK